MDFTINTSRLLLKPLTMEDVNRFFDLMSDKELTEFLNWEPHSNIQTTEDLLKNLINAQQNDRGYYWSVISDGLIIGLVSLIDVKRTIRTWTFDRAELSYWIGTTYQGKGYATEASKAIVDFGLNQLNFHKIIVAHANENVGSASICKKLNFNKYAYENDAFFKNGKWHDLIWYELIKRNNG